MKKFAGITAVILSAVMLLASCAIGGDGSPKATPSPTADPELVKNTINATIELESGDVIELELYPDLAPETVENFVSLAEDGFYDGTIFHRVIKNFMIQGGGYDENLKKKNADTIEGEFASNGFENTLPHLRGTISMARAQDVNSATSQFFIVQQDSTYLDGQYAAFGRVTEGMDVVDDIASERTGSVASAGMEDVPVDPIVIETITINSNSSKNSKSSKKSSKKDSDEEDDTSSKSSKSSKSDTNPFMLDDDDDEDEEDNDRSSSRATAKPSTDKSLNLDIDEDAEDLDEQLDDIARGFFENYSNAV